MKNLINALLTCTLLLMAGCSGIGLDNINATDEPLRIEEYFQGKTKAYGILFDRSGKATRHFNVDLKGDWSTDEQLLTLDENFVFDDGETSFRQWRITRLSEGKYRGEADDINGVATGESQGNAVLWRYVLNIPYKGQTIAVNFEDWMFLNENTLINRAVMRKFGFKVGEILLSFQRDEQQP